jgi:hypothetical protein
MAYPFVASPNRTRTDGHAIDVVVVHTMEAAERRDTAEAVARWFARPETKVSAHYLCKVGSKPARNTDVYGLTSRNILRG